MLFEYNVPLSGLVLSLFVSKIQPFWQNLQTDNVWNRTFTIYSLITSSKSLDGCTICYLFQFVIYYITSNWHMLSYSSWANKINMCNRMLFVFCCIWYIIYIIWKLKCEKYKIAYFIMHKMGLEIIFNLDDNYGINILKWIFRK